MNSECAIHVPLNPITRTLYSSNYELKATGNPYLALGSVIAAGVDGVCGELPIPPPVTVDPGHLSEDKLCRMDIEIYQKVKDVIDALSGDEVKCSQAYIGITTNFNIFASHYC